MSNSDLYLCIFMVLFVLFIISFQVVCRYVFASPLPWPDEVCTNMLVWITFLGACVVTRREQNIKITFFVERLPRRWQGWLFLFLDVLIGIFLFCILLGSVSVFKKLGDILLPVTQISLNWVFLAVPVSACIMLIHLIPSVCRDFMRLVRGEEVLLSRRLH